VSSTSALWIAQNSLRLHYAAVRRQTLELARGLSAEDCMLQSLPEASPVKWHLGHTTWFFETFVLARALPNFRPFNSAWLPLFNSYYLGLGEPHARARRGLLSRPALEEVLAWRERTDQRMTGLLATPQPPELLDLVALGLNHEEQHQELILTDLKHHFWCNPLRPVYRDAPAPAGRDDALAEVAPALLHYREHEGGLVATGHAGAGFAFDNEQPRHRVWLEPFGFATRLVSNGEYLAFMRDGGYGRAALWLSDGWDCAGARTGRRRCTGSATTVTGGSSRSTACVPCAWRSQSATSASTRPTPTRAGPARACRRRRSGSASRNPPPPHRRNPPPPITDCP